MIVMARDIPTGLWRNSVVMLILLSAHVMTHRKLSFIGVAPVGTDPCDGVNAFAFFTIVFIAIGSIPRMFSDNRSWSPVRYLYIVRSQQAVLFVLFITFTAEIIALVRNPRTWIGNHFAESLVGLICALTVVTLATLLLILFTQRNRISLTSLRWTRSMLPAVIAVVVLSVCPEWPTYSPSRTSHILTVALGALVVFIPMRLLLPEIVLNGSDGHRETGTSGIAHELTLLVGAVAVVLLSFFRHVPIFAGNLAMVFIPYALLGRLLGFAGRTKSSMQSAHVE